MSDTKLPKWFTVKQRDGSVWAVPVEMIARDRAKHYASEFGGDVERSLVENTIPAFQYRYHIQDWAVGNMNWSDFDGHHVLISGPKPLTASDFQDAWTGDSEHGYSDDEPEAM